MICAAKQPGSGQDCHDWLSSRCSGYWLTDDTTALPFVLLRQRALYSGSPLLHCFTPQRSLLVLYSRQEPWTPAEGAVCDLDPMAAPGPTLQPCCSNASRVRQPFSPAWRPAPALHRQQLGTAQSQASCNGAQATCCAASGRCQETDIPASCTSSRSSSSQGCTGSGRTPSAVSNTSRRSLLAAALLAASSAATWYLLPAPAMASVTVSLKARSQQTSVTTKGGFELTVPSTWTVRAATTLSLVLQQLWRRCHAMHVQNRQCTEDGGAMHDRWQTRLLAAMLDVNEWWQLSNCRCCSKPQYTYAQKVAIA